MTTNEIILSIISLISVFITSGAFVALFSIRSSNNKMLAEALKIKTESESIRDSDKLAIFKSQIEAANILSETMTKRIDQLGNRLTDYENRDAKKEEKIDCLENLGDTIKMDNLRLKRSFDILNRLFNRLLTILHSYFEIRSKALLNGLVEDPLAIEKLKKDIEDVENQYLEYDRSWKEDTQQLK
jgi:hypothetical protein